MQYKNEDFLIKNKTIPEKILFSVIFFLFLIYALVLIYPLIWGAISSVKSPTEYFDNIFGLPEKYKFSNYIRAFKEISDGGTSLLSMIWNSVWFAVGSAFLTSEYTSIFAYVLNKYKFKGRNFLFGICLFMISVPIGASFISTYRLMHYLNLTNSYLILLTATNVYGMNLILMNSYYSSIPWAYAEAAQVDGAGFFSIYFKIMRPQAKPIISTVFLFLFIGKWNDYMGPLLYLNKMPTLSTGLYKYQLITEKSGNYPVLFAGLIISLIPILLVYAIFSDRFMKDLSIGGLKG